AREIDREDDTDSVAGDRLTARSKSRPGQRDNDAGDDKVPQDKQDPSERAPGLWTRRERGHPRERDGAWSRMAALEPPQRQHDQRQQDPGRPEPELIESQRVAHAARPRGPTARAARRSSN